MKLRKTTRLISTFCVMLRQSIVKNYFPSLAKYLPINYKYMKIVNGYLLKFLFLCPLNMKNTIKHTSHQELTVVDRNIVHAIKHNQ